MIGDAIRNRREKREAAAAAERAEWWNEKMKDRRCDYPDCDCAISFPKGYRPSIETECPAASPHYEPPKAPTHEPYQSPLDPSKGAGRFPLTNDPNWPEPKAPLADQPIWRNPHFDTKQLVPTLPASIRVGYRDFKIEVWPKPKNDRFGECDAATGVLRLNPDLEGDHQVYIVLHELFHAIHDTAGLSESSTEEQIVGAYSGFLLQVWRDNPGFRSLMNGVV
jgi:hypothetical protein